MAELALTDFHEAVRLLVGDRGDVAIGYDYEAEQIDAALRTVVRSGWLPCVAVKSGDPTKLDPAPPNPDTWGWLVAKAAHLLIGGDTPISYKTRALSAFQDPAARRDTLTHIEAMLSDIDARGNLCGDADSRGNSGLFATVADVATYCRVGGVHPVDPLLLPQPQPLPPFT